MKVLVIGCGSIGKRHINNLIRLNNIENVLVCTKNVHCLDDLKNKSKIKIINSLNDVKADFAIIANETIKHLDTAILLAEKGINLFIEKPLSCDLDKVDILKDIVEKKKLKVFIAYNLRFLGAVEYIKTLISKKTIGNLYFAKIEVGQFLPFWRPDRDYRHSYSASRLKGGGVALDLSHEIDYMRYFFGDPCSWKVIKTKVSKLEIDSDDIFEGIYLFSNNFLCNVHMDYLQVNKKRNIRILGDEGTMICDFIGKYIKLVHNRKETVVSGEDMFDGDKTYMDELNHFIQSIELDTEPRIMLSDGIKALRLLEDGNV